MDNSVYQFFGMTPPTPENKPAVESGMNQKLSMAVEALGYLYDVIPNGASISFKMVHGKIILANPSGNEARQVGRLIVSKPVGVLDLEAQGGENANQS